MRAAASRRYKPSRKTKSRSDRWELPRFLILLALAALFLRSFVFAPFSIPSASMLPGLMVGDYLFVTKWSYGYSRYSLPFHLPLIRGRLFGSLPARGDVVVFKYPGPSKVDYVKRVIGLPGDRIRMADGRLVINGEPVPSTRIADWPMPVSPNSPCRARGDEVRNEGAICRYPRIREMLPNGTTHDTLDQGDSRFDDTATFTVPPGHLFAMGDNRDDSLDSRTAVAEQGVGFVPLDHLVGRAGISFWSTDGSFALTKPSTWLSSVRFDRIGATY